MTTRGSPAGIVLAFVMALGGAMLIAALAAPWVQAALASWTVFPLHRVFSRLTMLGVLLLTGWLLWRWRLFDRELLGFRRPWPRFLQRVVIGVAAGAALMLLAVVPLLLLDVREWTDRAPDAAAGWALLALKGLGTGMVVALIEETWFRGALQGALQRAGALRLALFAVPVLYAAVHFLGRAASVPYTEVDAFSGFTAWGGFFAGYAEPLHIADAFVALYLVGVLLALVRHRTGDIAASIGLHAGFVAVITMFRKASMPAPSSELGFLVGSFDGLLGMWVAVLAALGCVVAWRMRVQAAHVPPEPRSH